MSRPHCELVLLSSNVADLVAAARHLAETGAPRDEGELEVTLSGRQFRIRRKFLDDVAERRLTARVALMGRPSLLFHSPINETVGIENATRLFAVAKHPKCFISLTDADHLLRRRSDAIYVADVIAAWAERYIGGFG